MDVPKDFVQSSRKIHKENNKKGIDVTTDATYMNMLNGKMNLNGKCRPISESFLVDMDGVKTFYIKCGDQLPHPYYIYVMKVAHLKYASSNVPCKSVPYSAQEYVKLQFLPIGREVTIDRIGKVGPMGNIKYDELVKLDPVHYQFGNDPNMDYVRGESVYPITVTDKDGYVYRVDDTLWFHLDDLMSNIINYQMTTGKRFFPKTVYVDPLVDNGKAKTCSWVVKLSNYMRQSSRR